MSFCAAISREVRHDHQVTLRSSCAVGDHDGRLCWVSSANTSMLFTKKLRARVKSGEVTASVRIWHAPHVKVGGKYRLEEGHIELAARSGFISHSREAGHLPTLSPPWPLGAYPHGLSQTAAC